MISIQALVLDAGQTVAVPRSLCPKAASRGGDAVLMFCRSGDRVCTHYAGCGDGSCGCRCGDTLAEVEGQQMTPAPPANQPAPPSSQPATQRRQLQQNEEVDVHTTDGTQQRVRVVKTNPDGTVQVMPVASRQRLAAQAQELWKRFAARRIAGNELTAALFDVIAEAPFDLDQQVDFVERLETAEDPSAVQVLVAEIISALR